MLDGLGIYYIKGRKPNPGSDYYFTQRAIKTHTSLQFNTCTYAIFNILIVLLKKNSTPIVKLHLNSHNILFQGSGNTFTTVCFDSSPGVHSH